MANRILPGLQEWKWNVLWTIPTPSLTTGFFITEFPSRVLSFKSHISCTLPSIVGSGLEKVSHNPHFPLFLPNV